MSFQAPSSLIQIRSSEEFLMAVREAVNLIGYRMRSGTLPADVTPKILGRLRLELQQLLTKLAADRLPPKTRRRLALRKVMTDHPSAWSQPEMQPLSHQLLQIERYYRNTL